MEGKQITIEDLAEMVATGFNEVNGRIDRMYNIVGGLNGRFSVLEREIGYLTDGQERIELRLQQAAWQSDYREPNERVATIERKIGIKRKLTR